MAIPLKPKDEFARVALGLTQLRLGDDERGLESKGGITLMIKVSKDGYRGTVGGEEREGTRGEGKGLKKLPPLSTGCLP